MGRLTSGQARALETLSPKYVLPFASKPLDYGEIFQNEHPVILEIGFGMGDATADIAQSLPEKNFIGVEVHAPGVGHLLQHIQNRSLNNLRIIQHDAVEVVDAMIEEQSLSGIHVYFPDPWPKKRHHKRRLLQAPFLHTLASRLTRGGYFHFASDWEEYAREVLELVDAEPLLSNEKNGGGFAPRPDWRPLTKFENRGIKLGHGVYDIFAIKL
jgi:tRNA (guanine-N7-)-methyltransferase